MKKSDFHFDLPPQLIAQQPLAERSASRLLVLDVDRKSLLDRQFVELPDLLRAGDLLVFNDTRVLPARLYGRKSTGGAVEILIERVTGRHEATALREPLAGRHTTVLLGRGSSGNVCTFATYLLALQSGRQPIEFRPYSDVEYHFTPNTASMPDVRQYLRDSQL